MAMEGHRPGSYLRLKLRSVPCEMVRHFDPRTPLVVGGVGADEAGVGLMQVRYIRVIG